MRCWRLVVGIGLVALLLLLVGREDLAATLRAASPLRGFAVVLLLYVWLLLGALNVWLLLRRLVPLPLRRFLPAYLDAWATSLLLPGQLGDATQILFLRGERVPMSSSGAAYLVDKVLSLSWLIAVATFGVCYHFPIDASRIAPWLAWVFAGVAASVAILYRLWRRESRWIEGLLARVRRLGAQIGTFAHYRWTVALNLGLTIAKWIVLAVIYRAAFWVFGVEIGWVTAATFPVMSSLVGYLPISVGGAGTMEWTAVALFATVGIAAADVLCAYLLLRVVLLSSALAVLASQRLRGTQLR